VFGVIFSDPVFQKFAPAPDYTKFIDPCSCLTPEIASNANKHLKNIISKNHSCSGPVPIKNIHF